MAVDTELKQTLSVDPSSAVYCLPLNMTVSLGLGCSVCKKGRYANTYFAELL